MSDKRVWTVEIVFTEDEDKTRADAFLQGGVLELRGWGRARRNPGDPDVPAVGEEIAAARALHDLGHHLLERAATLIEEWEGHAVELHE
jgi:Rv2632c-like